MINQINKYLEATDHLRNNIGVFIEAFVKYYGEDRRKEIEEAISKVLPIAYRSPVATVRFIDTISKEKTKELYHKMIDGIETNFTEKDLLNGYDFKNENLMPISRFARFYELYNLGKEKREKRFIEKSLSNIRQYISSFTEADYFEIVRTRKIPEKYLSIAGWLKENILYLTDLSNADKEINLCFKNIKTLLEKIDSSITIDNFGNYLNNKEITNLINLSSRFEGAREEYNSFMGQYAKYTTEIENNETKKQELLVKYYVRLIKENIDLIPPDKRKGLEEFYEDPTKAYILDEYVRYILGYNINSNTPIESFSTDADNILIENEPKWQVDSIKRERINYFKKLGIDLGDDYIAYINDPNVQKNWPSKEKIDKYILSKNTIVNDYNIEYHSSLEEHQKRRQEIDRLGLLQKDDSFDSEIYYSNFGAFIAPNVRDTDNGYDLFSLLVLKCNDIDGSIDHNIVHELNHLIELYLQKADEKGFTVICGWDVSEELYDASKEIDTINNKNELRNCELFNEIINELIAQEVCEILHENNGYVFDEKNNSQIKNTTSYEHSFFLVRDFYSKYKEKIIESRRHGNIEAIWNEVGKENFYALNDLFETFNNYFSGMKIYSLYDDLNNNKDTELTRTYNYLVKQRDEILLKMDNYKKEQITSKTI